MLFKVDIPTLQGTIYGFSFLLREILSNPGTVSASLELGLLEPVHMWLLLFGISHMQDTLTSNLQTAGDEYSKLLKQLDRKMMTTTQIFNNTDVFP